MSLAHAGRMGGENPILKCKLFHAPGNIYQVPNLSDFILVQAFYFINRYFGFSFANNFRPRLFIAGLPVRVSSSICFTIPARS